MRPHKALWLAAALLAAFPIYSGATQEEAEVAERLSRQAEDFLASLLGPGRAKVLVSVEGEHSNTQTQTEVLTPIKKPEKDDPNKFLPGYFKEAQGPGKWDYVQKDQEQSLRQSGLIIKKLRVSVVLDSALSNQQVSSVSQLLPSLLHVDTTRGDELTLLRANIFPTWRSTLPFYLQSPEGLRTALVFGGAAVLALFVCLLGYITAMRAVKTFVRGIADSRAASASAPLPAGPQPLPFGGTGPIDLLPGGIPSLADPGLAGAGGPLPALGRRFDFLSTREPAEIAKLLAEEPPQDVALFFGYLADSNPDMASSIFSALPAAVQTVVSQALANLSMADPERLAMLENKMKNLVEFGVRGPERLGKILSRLPATDREALIGDVMSSSPQAAEEIGKSLFTFEDIGNLKPSEMRRLIMAVSYQEWGVALRSAPPDMVEKVLEQLLPGTQNLIREAMDLPQPRNKVMEARSKILSQAFAMAGRGELDLGREGSATELI